jgi:hypothetical protein
MKLIKLTRGKMALVDDDDFEKLNKHKWCVARRNGGGNYYACRTIAGGKTLYMHSEIIGNSPNMEIDHINGNGLDNRVANLRKCTHVENRQNSRVYVGRKFKGTKKNGNGFSARIVVNKKEKYLGTYKTEIRAAMIYNKFATMYFGEFARLNTVLTGKMS